MPYKRDLMMLPVLERLLRARILADNASGNIKNIKLILDTRPESKIRVQCNFLETELNSLISQIDARLLKVRGKIDKVLTEDFDLIEIVNQF